MRVNQLHTNTTTDSKHREKFSIQGEKGLSDAAKTEISCKARELAHTKRTASEAPDIREDRVSNLKKRILEGKYNVDGEAIADRMVDDHITLSDLEK